MGSFFEGYGCSDYRSFNAAGSAEYGLAFNKAVGDALFFAKRREGHDNFEGIAVCSHDDEFDFAFADGLKHFVDSFFDLPEREQLLQQLEYLFGEFGICHGFWLQFFFLGPLLLFLLCCSNDINEFFFLFFLHLSIALIYYISQC